MNLNRYEKQKILELICAQQDRMIKHNPLLFITKEYQDLEGLKVKVKGVIK